MADTYYDSQIPGEDVEAALLAINKGVAAGFDFDEIVTAAQLILDYANRLTALEDGTTAAGAAEKLTTTSAGANTKNAIQPVYFDEGIPKAITATSGSASVPVYAASGKFKPCTSISLTAANATKWNSKTMWIGTIAEYNALASKDSNTIYFCT